MLTLDQVLLAGLRGLHLIMLLALAGALAFRVVVAPPALAMVPAQAPFLLRGLRRQARWCAILGLLAGVGWFVAETAAIAGAGNLADLVAALPAVALSTRFGHLILVRIGLLLLAIGLIGRSDVAAAAVVLAATVLQGGFGHAGATPGVEGTTLLASEALHLVAAGMWFGALPLLWRWLAVLPPEAAACMSRRFTPVGMTAVMILAGTGLLQGLDLIGSVPGLIGTAYGRAALVKLGLFAVMVALALYNRVSLSERLVRPGNGEDRNGARVRFRQSVLLETIAGLMVVAAASVLASLTPALHEQPVWPFAWRPSLEALGDEDFRHEVVMALLLLGLATAAVTACLLIRRGRIIALGFLAFVLVTRTSSLGLLLVSAYPTSFYVSSTGFAARGLVAARAPYQALCSGCHGDAGRGDGPDAAGLPMRPADLTAAHLLDHPDGELFWWLSHGIDDPDQGHVMPGFERQLTEAQRWDMIDFLRARNAGVALREHGAWQMPVRAPSMPIRCADAPASQMQDLRGKVVQVIADAAEEFGPPEAQPRAGGDVVRLHLRAGDTQDCVTETPDGWDAYALLAGVSPDALAGTMFLVDPDGWLRAVYPPGKEGAVWRDPARLEAVIQQICANPIVTPAGGGHEHHQQ